MKDAGSPAKSLEASGHRVAEALREWLDIYDSCHRMSQEWNHGLKSMKPTPAVAAKDTATYGQPSEGYPATQHLYHALLNGARSLNEVRARYVLGGGLALNLHGHRRATKDVDFFILENHEKLDPIMASLARHDVREHFYEQPSFLPPDALFWYVPLQFGLPDAEPVKVDLLVGEHEFMAFIHATGIESAIGGVRVRVLGPEALIVLKLQAFRDKDRWDLKEVLKQSKDIDRDLLMAWVTKFKLQEKLTQMEQEIKAEGGRRFG